MIQTVNINLIPLSLAQLETGLRSIKELAGELNIPLVESLFDGDARRAVAMKIEKMRTAPVNEHAWYTYWLIVIRGEELGAGLVGFKGSPDEHGEVEIGYGIDPVFQNRGYTTEAVSELVEWAFSYPACHDVIAKHVRHDNYPSQKVLVKTGFNESGSDENGVSYRRSRK